MGKGRLWQWRQSGLKSGGSWIRVKKIRVFQANFDLFTQFHKIISIFPGKFPKNFNFFRQFPKKFDFPGKNWPFTTTSGKIILFLFKSQHFRTYLLYMIRYNNISRSVHDPTRPLQPHDHPAQNPGVATLQPPGLKPLGHGDERRKRKRRDKRLSRGDAK